MAKKVTVTRTATVYLDATTGAVKTEDPNAVDPLAAQTKAVTVIYVTRTRNPTATTTSDVACTQYVCPQDCDDWSCYESNFANSVGAVDDGSRTAAAADGSCPNFVRCVQNKCANGEYFSYDLARELAAFASLPLFESQVVC